MVVARLDRLLPRRRVLSVLRFAVVSGTGLAIDVVLFFGLVQASMRAGFANLISAALAVTFVYFVSARRIFAYEGRFLLPLFCIYLGYQAAAVALASWAVDSIVAHGAAPILAKGLVLPVTFTANYLCMAFITAKKA
ncbi:MAG TPA: GtrA family protein [Steroidobacter sp.]|uniref:GtrA family protein n=1 Tax=Steroidobacter sp. TaxID=1978227 RepID=UPI002EDA105D